MTAGSSSWMIYGANGYTGKLIVDRALKQGMRPVLAGRNEPAIKSLAAETGLEYRCFSLHSPDEIELQGMKLVMHCAGPFSATSAPMLEACLEQGVHYLDITGEIDVFEHAWHQSERATKADIVVCPGTGFDVVPTDCLAASLVAQVPAATELTLAFEAGGGFSRGTALTSVEGLAKGGRVRRDGKVIKVPLGWKSREIPFLQAKRSAVTIPWGDVFTAWVSTGVPDIEVYLSMPPSGVKRLRRMARLGPVLAWGWVQDRLRKQVKAKVTGPDEDLREKTGVEVWGEVQAADGRKAQGWLTGPNGYDITVTASLGIVEHLLSNDMEGGFYTPSLLMGADYAANLPGVSVKLQLD